MIRLNDIDLNLLVVFQHMYRERKTGLVAEQLGLSQPAISNALARLRKALGDELFERTARGMRPTPYADAIAEPIAFALSSLQDTINHNDHFDPAASTRSFRVAMTDLGEIHLLPGLLSRLAAVAPGVQLTTVRDTAITLKEEMEAGSVDLAVGLLPQLGAGFYQRRLFRQNYVCLMRRNHPLAKGEFGLEQFSEANHAVVVAQGTGHGHAEEVVTRSGVPRRISLRVPHFVAVPYIISETDLIVTVTEKLAQQTLQRFNLVARPHPMAIPAAQINIFWHRRVHQDAGNIWLRNLFFEMFSE